VQRLLQSGRKKMLSAISEGQALSFGEGDHVCIRSRPGAGRARRGRGHHGQRHAPEDQRPKGS
jgi:hypothetical protein